MPSGKEQYAVRGVLRYRLRQRQPPRDEVSYELRIVLVKAKDARAAKRAAERLFKRYNGTDHQSGMSLDIRFIGISGVCWLFAWEDDQEVWWEFVDERPAVGRRARHPRSGLELP